LKIHILFRFCSNEMIRVYFLKIFNNVHNYIYFLLKVLNHLNKKKIEYHYSITFQWPFFWKKKSLVNGFIFGNIIIQPMLNHFRLLYEFFFINLHYLRLFMAILNYFWLFLVISPYATFGYFKLFFVILSYFTLNYF